MNRNFYFLFLIMLTAVATGAARPNEEALAVIADRHSDPKAVEMAFQHLGRVSEPSSFWTRIANDDSYPIKQRRSCIMQLFRRHIRAGLSLGELAQRLYKPDWLSTSSFSRLHSFTGEIPVRTDDADTIFQLTILPPAKAGLHTSQVFIRISGHITKEQLAKLLNGESVGEDVKTAKIREVGFFQE
jgi:hypothetical protein